MPSTDNKLIKVLREIGLTENEASTYLASLSVGPASILQIARTSGIKRTTVYTLVESLKRQGLMSVEVRGWKQLFVAEDPKHLDAILESRKVRFHKMLPEFSALYNPKRSENTIKYHEGTIAIQSLFDDLLSETQPKDYWYAISDSKSFFNINKNFFNKFVKRRAKKNLDIKLLLQNSEKAKHAKKFQRNENTLVKILPPDTNLSARITITPHQIVFGQLTPPYSSVSLTNPHIIGMQKDIFTMLWENTSDTIS